MSSSERAPCNFCGERRAVLFCGADNAKLCLTCDHHVHKANLLSRKHVRSQMCDNCGNEPVSVRCFTEKLVLCQECDWDVHVSCSVSDDHVRSAVEGFSGCPSALELAALWGLDAAEGMMMMMMTTMELDSWVSGSNVLQELIVPVTSDTTTFKKRSPSCGRYKQVICKQLEELLKGEDNDRDRGGGGGEAKEGITVPVMPERVADEPPTTSFTSLMWNADNPSGQSTQIWDFNLGQSREPEDSSRAEAASFKINSFIKLLNDSTKAKGVKEICQDYFRRSTSGQVPATSEHSNLSIIFDSNSSNELRFTEKTAETSCNKTRRVVATKADLEQLAQNRGNAMQRYKEKRNNRRYDKTIRYESRKARADTRLRVKGRFVKASEAPYP